MNALHDYVIRMSKDQLPPAQAFWSITLYDMQTEFFIPNEQKKYSLGENSGMALSAEGGIDIYVAAEQPEGVPAENWLPINRQDEVLEAGLRICVPEFEAFQIWPAPQVQIIQ
jgi:hypothetical protein